MPSREYDIKPSDVEEWTATYLKAGERGLKINADEEQAEHERDREREPGELRANVSEARLGARRPKKLAPSDRPDPDGLLTVQSQMREEGHAASITRLCR
ncbi:MAG: hypothetical protein IPK07_12795 [Deltaproteobacteria bacterium]|nr:hypothetical protein [Deltaproteobacteria bacterium]